VFHPPADGDLTTVSSTYVDIFGDQKEFCLKPFSFVRVVARVNSDGSGTGGIRLYNETDAKSYWEFLTSPSSEERVDSGWIDISADQGDRIALQLKGDGTNITRIRTVNVFVRT